MIHSLLAQAEPTYPGTLLHYFFQYPKHTALDFFAGILKQALALVVKLNLALSTEQVEYLEWCYGADSLIPECAEIVDHLLVPLLVRLGGTTICVDGIEDCDHDQEQKVLEGLRRVRKKTKVKLLVTGTSEMNLSGALRDFDYQIPIDQGANSEAIELYITERLGRLTSAGHLFEDADIRDLAQSELLRKADGM